MSDRVGGRSRANFWIGLVFGGIVAAALLFSVYYVPRKGITFGNEAISFTVVLEQAHGLHAGSPVYVSGIEAGEVSAVEIRALDRIGYRVLATVEVFDGERFGPMLKTDSTYQVASSGLLGEVTLAIAPGGSGLAVANQLVNGVAPTDFGRIVDDLGYIAKRLADFMDAREPGDPNVRRALVDLQTTIRNLRDFSGNLPR